jgi:hypothetical protein
MRSRPGDPNKIENELEQRKASKQGDQMNEASDVAGRKGKGLGLVEKLAPGKSGQTPESMKTDGPISGNY